MKVKFINSFIIYVYSIKVFQSLLKQGVRTEQQERNCNKAIKSLTQIRENIL